MKDIPLPQKFEYKEITKNKGQVTIEPFYPGYGTTIGNSLRRVLLSSLVGMAVTAVKIKGVDQEFSSIPNVKEDVIDIILNLKKLRLKITEDIEESIKLNLKVIGEKVVTAGDFEKKAGIEITNTEFKIATITEAAGELEMEIWVEKGRGYLPIELRTREEKEIGVIDIDAHFSPVKQVGLETERVRVGEITNYERIILTIETDGTINYQECIAQTLKILIDHLQYLFNQVTGKIPHLEKKEEVTFTKEQIEKPMVELVPETKEKEQKESEEKAPKRKRGRPRKNESES